MTATHRTAWAFAICLLTATPVVAQTSGRLSLSIESALVGQWRNDVRIPPVGGSDFSIVDIIGRAPTPSVRMEATARLTDRQDVRFTYAPIRIAGGGVPRDVVLFAGERFEPADTDAEFKFSSYRATWRYRVHQGEAWQWRVGVTAFIRDARIALTQTGAAAEDTDVGFVPLGHVSADARLGPRWRVSFDLDGTAAPQGRAFDFAALLNYQAHPRLTLSAGYRTIEGGADVRRVYTFAWLNAAVARATIGF